jgi:hypothetical protein
MKYFGIALPLFFLLQLGRDVDSSPVKFSDKKLLVHTEQDSISMSHVRPIFESICKTDATSKVNTTKKCSFDYKQGDEPDVDVFDESFDMAWAKFSDSKFATEIINNYYQNFSTNCVYDSSSFLKFQKDSSFQMSGPFAMQLDYRTGIKGTTALVCLMYGENWYVLLTMSKD